MLIYLKGDIFNSPAQVIVNTVNTVGVMGKGIALTFKQKYPDMFREYQGLCDRKLLEPGKLFLWKKSQKWILLFPTKVHWRNPSKLEYIEQGLKKFVDNWQRIGINSIAFPRLGCGNGNLDWNDVRPLMEKYLKSLPINIYIYVDNYKEEKAEHLQTLEIEKWLNSNVDAIGFRKLKADLKQTIANDNSVELSSGEKAYVTWNEENIVIKNGSEHSFTEEHLSDFWYYLRDNGVINIDDVPEYYTEIARLC
jgi:O-acetyl-ADP-ribose deacetylase (regulator of RNase III)